jgi:hypothetical protein
MPSQWIFNVLILLKISLIMSRCDIIGVQRAVEKNHASWFAIRDLLYFVEEIIMPTQQTALLKTNNRSGGPRTVRGKATVRSNSVTHGLRSQEAVVLGERTKEWKAHLAGIIASLKPVGSLEEELAEQVATITWRMRRVLRYESGVMSGRLTNEGRPIDKFRKIIAPPPPRTCQVIQGEIETARQNIGKYPLLIEAFQRLKAAPSNRIFDGQEAMALMDHASACMATSTYRVDGKDPFLLIRIDMPYEGRIKPESWTGWTAEFLMKAMQYFGSTHSINAPDVIERVLDKTKLLMDEQTNAVKRLEAELLGMATEPPEKVCEEDEEEEEVEDHDPIMDPTMLNNVMRYGGHLRRELNDALDTLNCLQTNRRLGIAEEGATESARVVVEPKLN